MSKKGIKKIVAASRSTADTTRLNWLIRNISGREARELGMIYSNRLQRKHIDAVMSATQEEHDATR